MNKERDLFPSERKFLATSESFRKEEAKKLLHKLMEAQTRVDVLRTEAAKLDAKGQQVDRPAIEKAQKEMMGLVEQVRQGGEEFRGEVFGQIDKRQNEFAERKLRLAEKPLDAATQYDLNQVNIQDERTEKARGFLEAQLGTTEEKPPA